MNVAAEQVFRLMAIHKIPDCPAACMESIMHAVKVGAMGWSVADQHERLENGKRLPAVRLFQPRCILPAY